MTSAGEYSRLRSGVVSVAETIDWYRRFVREVSDAASDITTRIREDGLFYNLRDMVWEGSRTNPLRFAAEHPGLVTLSEVLGGFRSGVVHTVTDGDRFARRTFFPYLALASYAIGKPVVDGITAAKNGVMDARQATSNGDRATAVASTIGGVSAVFLTFLGGAGMATGNGGGVPMIGTTYGPWGNCVAVAGATSSLTDGVAAAIAGGPAAGVFIHHAEAKGSGEGLEESRARIDDQKLAEALERHGGNRVKVGKDVGLSLSGISGRIDRAGPESPLHRFKEIKGKGGVPSRIDDSVLTGILKRERGNRKKAAQELGVSRTTISLHIEKAGADSPLAAFKDVDGRTVSLVDDNALAAALERHKNNYAETGRDVGLGRSSVRRRVIEAGPDSPLARFQGVKRKSMGGGRKLLVSDEVLVEVLERCKGNRNKAVAELQMQGFMVDGKYISKRVRRAGSDSPLKKFQGLKAEHRPCRVDDDTLAGALDKHGGNRTRAAKEVGLGQTTVNNRIENAKPGSLLHRFQEMKGKGGVGLKADDVSLAEALRRNKGDRIKAAGEVGLKPQTVAKRVAQSEPGSPLEPFKGRKRISRRSDRVPDTKPPQKITRTPKKKFKKRNLIALRFQAAPDAAPIAGIAKGRIPDAKMARALENHRGNSTRAAVELGIRPEVIDSRLQILKEHPKWLEKSPLKPFVSVKKID